MDFLDSYYSQFFDNFNFFFFDKSLFCPGLFSDLLCNDGLTFTSVVYCLSIHSIDFIIVRRRSLFTRNFQKTSFQFRVFHIYMHYAYRFISVYIIRIAICSHSLEIRDYCLMEGLQNLPYSILFGIQNPSNLFIS